MTSIIVVIIVIIIDGSYCSLSQLQGSRDELVLGKTEAATRPDLADRRGRDGILRHKALGMAAGGSSHGALDMAVSCALPPKNTPRSVARILREAQEISK